MLQQIKINAPRLHAWLLQARDEWAGATISSLLPASLILCFIWWLTLSHIHDLERQAIRNTITNNQHLATVIRSNLEQVLGKTVLYADLATELVNGDRNIHSHLNPTEDGNKAYLRLAVFSADGQLLHSSARQKQETELDFFARKATGNWHRPLPADALLIGRPYSIRNPWRIPLLMKISQGKEHGYLAAILDLGHFLQLFQEVQLGEGGHIEIIHNDGYQLAESTGTTLSAGRNYQASDYLQFLRNNNTGGGIIRRSGDKTDTVTAFHRLDRYPLTVAVSLETGSMAAGFMAQRNYYIGIASLVSILVMISVGFFMRGTYRRNLIHRELIKKEDENRKLIAQLEENTKYAYELASHDHLTGLPNRMLFTELASSRLKQARRSPHDQAIYFIDLDRFKNVNDTLGHRVGDLLLQEVAHRLQSCLRESDVVARFGGDEFVMLISDIMARCDLETVSEKIILATCEPYMIEGHRIEISPSIGIALCPQDGENIDTLLQHADTAMYAAKQAGRSTYRFHDNSLNAQGLRSMELEQCLRGAIRNKEFVLYYQPRVKTKRLVLAGLEALIRWNHPELGMIGPDEFIPLAEKNDQIIPLGYWIIHEVCEQIADWRRRGVPLVPVAVNVSAKQFQSESLANDIFSALEKYDIPADLFEIEITETSLLDMSDQAANTLSELARRGINIYLDDFGTGFANLGRLKTLPLHAIKIDRFFINEINSDDGDSIIVSSTTRLAHDLGLNVIAEGVETKSQLSHLKSIGCNEVQGYYFQRPASAADIEVLLHKGNFAK